MSQQLYGDYVVYSYADADNDSRMLMAMGSVGKTLDFMRGSCNVNGSFSRNESQLLSQQQSVNSVSTGWSIGGKINGNPCRWFSFDYSIDYSDSRLTMNGMSESWLSTMENELSLTFIPYRKWQWTVSGEHYRNEITENSFNNVVMLDTKLIYQLNKRIELAASLTNIPQQAQLQLHHLFAALVIREPATAPRSSAPILDNPPKISIMADRHMFRAEWHDYNDGYYSLPYAPKIKASLWNDN